MLKYNNGSKVTYYLVLSQLSLYLLLGVCVIIEPRFVLKQNEGGASNYGIHWATTLPYSLAFLLCSAFILRAANFISSGSKSLRQFRNILLTTACLLIFALLTTYPYKINSVFDDLHTVSAIALCCSGVAMAAWMTLRIVNDRVSLILLAIELAGFLVSAFTFFGVTHLLFVGELITGLSFGLILIWTDVQLVKSYENEKING
jgi:hypothetical protein